jgi:N-methylhydantoinase A
MIGGQTLKEGGSNMYYWGIDIGGTFTDVAVMDEQGKVETFKVESTPKQPWVAVMEAVKLASESMRVREKTLLEQSAYFAHGTTVATNSLLQRKGARTGLITTKGFRDTLFIQRMMGLTAGLGEEEILHYSVRNAPSPIVPRHLVKEVSERIDYKGVEVVGLNEDEARKAVRELVDQGVEAIAVCFLWSFKNPAHEEKMHKIIAEEARGMMISVSSEVMPVIREYERTVTTVFNAFLNPTISSYIDQLAGGLSNKGFKGTLTIMSSSGGTLRPAEARKKSVYLINSGPCGGVASSVNLGMALGYKNIIATDMGGTSFDAGLIVDGKPSLVSTTEVAGYLVHVPMVNITSIGAGGGSIARIEAGKLKVGPESAGADPGPVCYSRGGTEPTATDADVVLGLIDPDYFLGGRIKLDKAHAERVIEEKIAKPLGMDVVHAAAGIKQVLDSQMADLLRALTIKRGYDPRDFVLFAYGGAGPTHCSSYGAQLRVKCTVIPFSATIHSAFGAVSADFVHIFELSDVMRTAILFDVASKYLDCERITHNFESLEEKGRLTLRGEGVRDENMNFHRSVEVRYRRQTNELSVPVSGGKLGPSDIDGIVAAFEKKYEELYGRGTAYREAGVELTLFRVEGVGRIPKPVLRTYAPATEDTAKALVGERRVYLYEIADFCLVKVYDGLKLMPRHVLDGPAIIQYPGTTVVIGSDQRGMIDDHLNVVSEQR